MTKTSVLLAAAFATALATSASAQSLTTHAPPSDKATQGTGIDPNYHKSGGGLIDPNDRKFTGALVPAVKPVNAGSLIDPNERKNAGSTIDPNERKSDAGINYANTGDNRIHGAGGGAGHGSDRMGVIIEDHK